MSQYGKIYFASDFHLGIPDYALSFEREKKIVRWLNSIEKNAATIYLVGDIFDFWFEYKRVVPKGYVRLLGTLANLKDKGIDIQIFTGNHDLWMFGYFEKELGITVHRTAIIAEHNGKKFYIGHGDGVGPGDKGYKLMKRVFNNRFSQWLFSQLHPDLAIKIANFLSHTSRKRNEDENFLGEEKEWQILFAKSKMKTEHIDYFVFGHRHIPLFYPLENKSIVINLGDWISYNSYAVFDGNVTELKYFEK